MTLEELAKAAQQGSALVGIVVPAVQSIIGVVLQIAQQARNRGWDVDTASLQDTAAKFDRIAAAAREEQAKYKGKE
jgi:hypothetical protein